MRISVLIPTYRRATDLARCLAAVRGQGRRADEVLVVMRPDDEASAAVVSGLATSWLGLRRVTVTRPGVVAAMNAGLAAASGDVLALTDDDAEPEADWLACIETLFEARPDAAGVGGRDVQAGVSASASDVGRVQWFGRVVGNHHIGVGAARDVDVVKGANCAFRVAPMRAIGFDERLKGAGAQVHWELALCLALRRAGWGLVYDPAMRVVHHVGVRHDADQLHRGRFDAAPHEDAVFNETLVLAGYLTGVRRFAFAVWARIVGTGESPGLLQLPRVVRREGRQGIARWRATQRARSAGLKAAR